MDTKRYKEVILKFFVEENFEIGDCGKCQLSILGDDGYFYCPMFTESEDCLLEQVKEQTNEMR